MVTFFKNTFMETKVDYATVGAFVIGLLAAFIIIVIWLSAGFSSKHYKTYLVYMNESVAGLNIDSPVKYNGVAVGYVKSIDLNPKDPQQVKLLVDLETDTPITEDTRATLTIQGLTGVASLGLKNTGPSTEPLRKTHGEDYPIIKTAPSLFTRLDTALTDLTTNLSHVSKSIDATFDPENQRALKQILQHLNVISANLADNSSKLSAVMQNTAKATEQFPMAMQTFANQTLPATNQLLNTLQIVSDNLVVISSEIKQNPAIIIRGQKPSQLGPGEK